MKTCISLFVLLALVLASCGEDKKATSEDTNTQTAKSTNTNSPDGYKTIGTVERLSPLFDQYVKPGATVEVIAEGFDWSEGPLWLPAQQKLIWSDVPRNIIYQWSEGKPFSEYLKPAGYTGEGNREGSNGLLLSPDGRLIICQHGDRRMAAMNGDPAFPVAAFKTISGHWEGKRFNSPNDAAYGPENTMYFTDPPYGLPGKDEDPDKEIPFNGVYKARSDGGADLMDSTLTRPNGIAFNTNMTRCYVANSDPERAIWKVYELDEANDLINGKVFFDATAMVATNKGLPDGLKVNRQGIIFATGPGGVLVFNPAGEHLGTIATGEAISNCAFNEDESVLYMTSDMYVARVRLR